MRPDARLLCLCSLLPFIPDGARSWGGVDGLEPCWTGPRPPGSLLDLSEPTQRYGWMERLDVAPWAARALYWTGIPVRLEAGRFLTPVTPREFKSVTLCLKTESERMQQISDYVFDLDLSGLDDEEAGRAVLAYAMRHPGFR